MKGFAAICVVLLLVSARAPASSRTSETIVAGDGAVLLIVAIDDTRARTTELDSRSRSLKLERVDVPEHPSYSLGPKRPGLPSASVYGGSLPPGRYRIRDVFGDGQRNRLPDEHDLAQFDIVPGEVTWLGAIMVREEPTLPKGHEVLWAYDVAPSVAAGERLIRALYPEMEGSTPKVAIHWQRPAEAEQAASDARQRMLAGSVGQNDFGSWGQDGFCFGAQHGVAKCWNPARGYGLLMTGIPFNVWSVLRRPDGQVLAAGEASSLLYSSDDGLHWSDEGRALPWGTVLQVADIGNDEVLFTLFVDNLVYVYRGHISERKWRKVGEFPLQISFLANRPETLPSLLVQGRTAVLSLPTKRAVYFDLSDNTSRVFDLPGEVTQITFGPDGTLSCLCSFKPFISRDQGRTWATSPFSSWLVLPAFRNADEGFTFNLRKGDVMGTTDGGRSWTPRTAPASRPNIGWWHLPAYTRDGSVMVLFGRTLDKYANVAEEIHVSLDDGKSWKLVSEPPAWLREAAAAGTQGEALLRRW